MTSRERLLAALNGVTPDRVPVSTYELVGYDSENFCNKEPSYKALMDDIRERTDCVCMWDARSNSNPVASGYAPETERRVIPLPDGHETLTRIQAAGRALTLRTRVIDGVYTTWTLEHWCKDLEDVDALMALPYEPVISDASDYARVAAEVGDNGIIMSSLADAAYTAMALMEFGEAMIWVMKETEHFASVVRTLHERVMENLESALDTRAVDLYRICGPEYMTPPYLPPEFFSRFMTPCLKDMVSLIHSKGAKARVHCHGRIASVLDDIASTGADAIDPCEGPPDGDIELADVKRRVGGSMTIFGNMQLKLLENGTERAVRDAVRSAMDAAKAGGRFVIMPTAAPINVPLSPRTEALYRAYIDAALEFGGY